MTNDKVELGKVNVDWLVVTNCMFKAKSGLLDERKRAEKRKAQGELMFFIFFTIIYSC